MADKKNLPVFDFKKVKKEEIHAFLKENATPQEKRDFRAVAFPKKPETMLVPEMITDAEGNTAQKQVRKKQKDGTYKTIPKYKAVAVKGGAVKEKYSHRDAVSWFIKTYVDVNEPKAIMINRPEKKQEEKKQAAKDLFADLWE